MSRLIRQAHRWVSATFVAIVVFVSVAGATQEDPPEWIFYLPLLPLFALMLSGIYLFVLPYVSKSHERQTG